jgi:hypothetical protein
MKPLMGAPKPRVDAFLASELFFKHFEKMAFYKSKLTLNFNFQSFCSFFYKQEFFRLVSGLFDLVHIYVRIHSYVICRTHTPLHGIRINKEHVVVF